MIDEYNINGLPDDNDRKGPVSDLIKIIRACEKSGIEVKDVINVLKRPDKKEVLKEINEFSFKKTEATRKLEEIKAQEQRASDFGIGEY